MLLVLDALAEYSFYYYAANKAGIHPKTLAYWIRRSEAGDDGYDIGGKTLRGDFTNSANWRSTRQYQILLDSMFERGFVGYDKVLSYRGRVVYKIDQGLVDLGCQGPDAYLRDENGDPIPETVRKVDMKAMRFWLAWHRPEKWGRQRKIKLLAREAYLSSVVA